MYPYGFNVFSGEGAIFEGRDLYTLLTENVVFRMQTAMVATNTLKSAINHSCF